MKKVVLLLLIVGFVSSCSDDVQIPEIIQPCQPVVASFTSNITDTSARLNWCGSVNDAGECLPVTGVTWVASYGVPGFDPDAGTIVNAPTTSTNIGGLTPQTTYEFYVKSDCNLTNNEWFGPVQFRTSCPAPTDLAISNLTKTSVTFNWTPGGSEIAWEIKYGQVGFNLDEVATVATGNSTEHTVMDLQPNTEYEFYVRANCNDSTDGSQAGSSSSFTGPFRFVTCLPPINLTSTPTQNSVVLDWDSNGETSWEVRYGEAAGFNPDTATAVTTNNSTYTVTGLCPETLYTFVVRSSCGTATTSAWVNSGVVGTPALGYTGMYTYEEVSNTDEPIFGDPVAVDIVSVSDTERSITVKYLANLDVGGTQPTMTFNFTLNCDGTVSVNNDQDTNFNCGGANVLLGLGAATPTTYNMVNDETIDIRFIEDTGSAMCTNAPMTEVVIRLTKI